MMRTTVSFLLLFGCLLVVAKALEPSQAQDRPRASRDGRSSWTRSSAAKAPTSSRRRPADAQRTSPDAQRAEPSGSRAAAGSRKARNLAKDPRSASDARQDFAPLQAEDSAATTSDPALPAILLAAPEVDRGNDEPEVPVLNAPSSRESSRDEPADVASDEEHAASGIL